MASRDLRLKPEHFYDHLFQSGGLYSILVCTACLVVVFAIVFFFAAKWWVSQKDDKNGAGELRRKQYEEVLGHIRALEALRMERELLVKRALRVVNSWEHQLPTMAEPVAGSSAAAGGGDSSKKAQQYKMNKKALTLVEDLSEEVRMIQRDHQLLLQNTMVVLGEHDTAGVLKSNTNTNPVWMQAMEAAQKRAEKKYGSSAFANGKPQVEVLSSSSSGDDDEDQQKKMSAADRKKNK